MACTELALKAFQIKKHNFSGKRYQSGFAGLLIRTQVEDLLPNICSANLEHANGAAAQPPQTLYKTVVSNLPSNSCKEF